MQQLGLVCFMTRRWKKEERQEMKKLPCKLFQTRLARVCLFRQRMLSLSRLLSTWSLSYCRVVSWPSFPHRLNLNDRKQTSVFPCAVCSKEIVLKTSKMQAQLSLNDWSSKGIFTIRLVKFHGSINHRKLKVSNHGHGSYNEIPNYGHIFLTRVHCGFDWLSSKYWTLGIFPTWVSKFSSSAFRLL